MIERAKEVLANLEKAEFNELGEPVAAPQQYRNNGTGRKTTAEKPRAARTPEPAGQEPQLGLFASEAGLVFRDLQDMNIDAMTPLEAMNKLHELKKRAGG